MDYTSRANVKSYGNVAQTTDDMLIEGLVTAYSRQVDQYCQQQFGSATYADQVLGALVAADGVLTCWPAVPTISAITAAAYRAGNSASWIALTASELDTEEHTFGCTVRLLGRDMRSIRGGRLRVQLSYSGGWANLAAVPADFEWAMRRLCWWAYKLREAPISKTAMPEFGSIVIPPSGWPKDIRDAFSVYIRQVPL